MNLFRRLYWVLVAVLTAPFCVGVPVLFLYVSFGGNISSGLALLPLATLFFAGIVLAVCGWIAEALWKRFFAPAGAAAAPRSPRSRTLKIILIAEGAFVAAVLLWYAVVLLVY